MTTTPTMRLPGFTAEAAQVSPRGAPFVAALAAGPSERGQGVVAAGALVCRGLRITCNLTGCYLHGHCSWESGSSIEF